GQDTAVPQGAGPPFHPPLKPADNLPRGDLLGRPPAELPFILDLARHASLRQLLPPHPQLPTNLFARELRPPIAVLHDEGARLIYLFVPSGQGGPQPCSGVPPRRLDVNPPKRGPLADLAVHNTVHGAPARKTQPRHTIFLIEGVEHMNGRLFKDHL